MHQLNLQSSRTFHERLRIFNKRLSQAIATRGVRGTMKHYLRKSMFDLEGRIFDLRHHVETGGTIWMRELNIESANRTHGYKYQGTPPSTFREIMGAVPIDHSKFVF